MNFNTVEFLLIFLPLSLAAFHLAPPRARLAILLIASVIFYGATGAVTLFFMLAAIFWGFASALVLSRMRDRFKDRDTQKAVALFVALAGPFLVLFLFKYLDFTLYSVGASDSVRDRFLFFLAVTLPPGISFYTFQIASYVIDVNDDRIECEPNTLKFSVFVSLFPQLIAGPIVRFAEMSPQLDQISRTREIPVDVRGGLKFLSIGLFGKVAVADLVGLLIGNSRAVDFTGDATRLDALWIFCGYSMQIFFDFWAYSLMAIGIAKLFGISLPVNFREPYQALNPRDFWRRWHVTLSFWLRDYVYVKLGGNNAYVRNILIVFLACGLWHGAGWSFVLWGAYHAVLVLGYHFTAPIWDRMPKALQVGTTFLLVSFGWPLFFVDAETAIAYVGLLFSPSDTATGVYGLKHWVAILPILAWVFLTRERYWLYNEDRHWFFDNPVLHGILASVALLFATFSATFIYFRF